MQYKIDTKKPNLFCLILLISFPSVATVLISPALPAISIYFHATKGYTQQLITLFVVGYALSQLIYSPFANRYGRKMAAYLGIGLYLISCLICLFAIYIHSLNTLLLGRLLMAFGSGVGMIISFTIINDFFKPEQIRSVTSYTVLAYAFMPALAITLGGFITTRLSWIDCFYFYLIYGFVILFVCTRLPETLLEKNLTALKIKPLVTSFVNAFKHRRLILFSLIYGLMASFIYIIASDAPFIAINKIGLSAADYGLLLLIPYCGQIFGALIAGKISQTKSAKQVMLMGYACVIFGSGFMFICFAAHWIAILSLILPIFFIMLGLPMTYSTVTVMAIANYHDKATGAAVMSFITMMTTLFATFVLTLLPNAQPLVMPSLFIVICILAVWGFLNARPIFAEK